MKDIQELLARRLMRDIHYLRSQYGQHPSKRDQEHLINYLTGVHVTYSSLRRRKWAKRAGHLIAAVYDLPNRPRHPIGAIIDATSSPDADAKAKSRATRALRFVWQRRSEWGGPEMTIGEFLHQNGGISGCAAKFAQAKRDSQDRR